MTARYLFRPRPLLRRPARLLGALGLLLVPLLGAGGVSAEGPGWRSASSWGPAHLAGVPFITATAAVLMDARSGQVIYADNPDLPWPPASTTKIMTALVAIETMPLDARIRISPRVARFRVGSAIGLPEGRRVPLHDLLYGLMLQSGNDAALAVAEGVGGTVDAFVARMNDEAHRLGATRTHFTSPHGLFDPDHYSTAYDLALLTRVAMQNPTFREIVRTRRWTWTLPGGGRRFLWNHNRLLARYPGADGVKTGYIHQSGQTLVASAVHQGWRLIAVLLHARDLWGDASRLLSYGFTRYRSVELARAGEELATIEVAGADRPVVGIVPEPVYGALAPGEEAERRISLLPHLAVPIRQGERIGEVAFYASGRLMESAPLVAAQDVGSQAGLHWIVEWIGRVVHVRKPPGL
ncbi:MAG TPA: D-alanyl-D-alanine carboxypeptidase family protein [bacterium]|nr:D-alanyl-D-alanine carboxypeptidase family protein [bacterium]